MNFKIIKLMHTNMTIKRTDSGLYVHLFIKNCDRTYLFRRSCNYATLTIFGAKFQFRMVARFPELNETF